MATRIWVVGHQHMLEHCPQKGTCVRQKNGKVVYVYDVPLTEEEEAALDEETTETDI
jgi:hypothetical protein